MKKKIAITTGLVAIIASSFAFGVNAASDIKLFINGKAVATPIEIIDGSSYVPLRIVSESLGADVKWDGDARTISITGGAQAQDPSAEGTYTAGDFVITDVTAENGQFGWDVMAEVRVGKDIKAASLTATFYGADGKRVGKATGTLLDTKAGESKTVTFITLDDLTGYTSIKFQVDYSY